MWSFISIANQFSNFNINSQVKNQSVRLTKKYGNLLQMFKFLTWSKFYHLLKILIDRMQNTTTKVGKNIKRRNCFKELKLISNKNKLNQKKEGEADLGKLNKNKTLLMGNKTLRESFIIDSVFNDIMIIHSLDWWVCKKHSTIF